MRTRKRSKRYGLEPLGWEKTAYYVSSGCIESVDERLCTPESQDEARIYVDRVGGEAQCRPGCYIANRNVIITNASG